MGAAALRRPRREWYDLPSEHQPAAPQEPEPEPEPEQVPAGETKQQAEEPPQPAAVAARSIGELRRLEASLLTLLSSAEASLELAQYLSEDEGGGLGPAPQDSVTASRCCFPERLRAG